MAARAELVVVAGQAPWQPDARRRPDGAGQLGLDVGAGEPRVAAGVELHAKPGDSVTEGQALLTLHTDEPDRFDRALAALADGVVVGEPGTAYDDDVLGRDPQPAHMDDYVQTTDDNGGVHINSGIPNHAFYLTATALGGRIVS